MYYYYSMIYVYSLPFSPTLTVASGDQSLDAVVKFIACGDLSGFDSDKVHPIAVSACDCYRDYTSMTQLCILHMFVYTCVPVTVVHC